MSNYPSGHFPRLPIDVYMQVIDDSDEVPKINFKKLTNFFCKLFNLFNQNIYQYI